MSDTSELDWVALAEYLAGGADADRAAAIERWVGEDPDRRVLIERLRGVWERNGHTNVKAFDVVETERQVLQRIAPRDALRNAPLRTSSVSHRRATAWMLAAAGVCGVVLGSVVLRNSRATPQARATQPSQTYATTAGQTATVRLRGGSHVTLGPATTVRVSVGDAGIETIATVEGEAFFAVTHSATTPFVVRAGAAETRVLGTAFVVRHYANESRTRVVVTEGRVAVQGQLRGATWGAPAVLVVRTLAEVGDSGEVRVTPNVALDDYTAWTMGRLSFHGTPLRDVVADLARTYGADIRVTDSLLAQQPITLSASVAADPLSAVMDFLARAADAHWVRVKNTFTLEPGRAASTSSPSHFPSPEIQYGR